MRRLRRNRREGRPVIYLDETWANARDGVEKMWVEDDPRAIGGTKGGIRKPSGKAGLSLKRHTRAPRPLFFLRALAKFSCAFVQTFCPTFSLARACAVVAREPRRRLTRRPVTSYYRQRPADKLRATSGGLRG